MQAPRFNKLYSAIQEDPGLSSKVKIMGIGVGNNKKEAAMFREERGVQFPILPDPKFKVYEELVGSV